jgi:hypothetical protein
VPKKDGSLYPERQVDFGAGELSPRLWGRTDLSLYASGVRRLRNFIVTPEGVLVNRPGTQHIRTLHNVEVARVVPWIFSETDNYILLVRGFEFDSGSVLAAALAKAYKQSDSDPRHSFDIGAGEPRINLTADDATADDIWTLRFVQVGNLVTVVSTKTDPYELERLDDDPLSWNCEPLSFAVPDFVQGYPYPPVMVLDIYGTATPPIEGDASHPARQWRWQVTRIMRDDATGRLYETMPYTVDAFRRYDSTTGDYVPTASVSESFGAIENIAIYPDWAQKLEFYVGNGYAVENDQTIHATRIYRGREGRFGFLGETKSSSFWDDGAEPDYSNPPPQGANPLEVYSGETLLRTERPGATVFFGNRRYLAGTEERPSMVLGSALAAYENFDEVLPADSADALRFDILSDTSEVIRHMLATKRLIAVTSSGVWVIGGADGGGNIDPTDAVGAYRVSRHGASERVAPIQVGNTIFYTDANRTRVWALNMVDGNDRESADVVDTSTICRHLFDGYTIVDLAYQRDPYPILWAVRSDGALLSMSTQAGPQGTYYSWAPHFVAGGGLVRSVAAKPEGTEDGVYIVVDYDGTLALERLAYRVLPYRTTETEEEDGSVTTETQPDVRYAIHLDRSVSWNGKNQVDDAEHAITFDGDGGLDDQDVGGYANIQIGTGTVTFAIDTVLQVDDPEGGKPYRFLVTGESGGGSYQVQLLTREMEEGNWLWSAEVTDWYECRNSVAGLTHLNGETVVALVDGNVVEDLEVTAGSVSVAEEQNWSRYGAIIHVGLPYDSDLETLDIAHERTRQKVVAKVFVELDYSRGGEVGESLDGDMYEVQRRDVDDEYLTTIPKRHDEEVAITGKWGTGGRVAFRQSHPLPVTVLGLTRLFDYGG